MRRFSLASAVLLTSCLLQSTIAAQSLGADPRVKQSIEILKTWLDAQRAYEQVPGISVAIVRDQDVIWSGGYGWADIAQKKPATANTIYSICSISKLFTSISTMQLRDAGKLRLDDPIQKHLSWFTIKNGAPQAGPVTIEGLLTHASGLPRESDYPSWTAPDFTFPSHDQVVERLRAQEMQYPAETFFQYSNLGMALAGEVVAAVSGMPYSDYARKQILMPLGMTSTTTEMPESERGKRLATGYTRMLREGMRNPMPFYLTKAVAPAAGYASTVEDMAKFASWQFRVLGSWGNEILGANTLREMQRVHFTDPGWKTTYGLGFSVWRHDDKTFVGHGGSCPGYRSHLLLQPTEKVAAVFMSNALGVDAGEWAQNVYDIMNTSLRAAAKGPHTGPAADPTLDKYVGSYEWSWGETAVVRYEDGLALLDLPNSDPMKSLTKLKKTGEHTFQRVRPDDTLGETYEFKMNADGRPESVKFFSNVLRRFK